MLHTVVELWLTALVGTAALLLLVIVVQAVHGAAVRASVGARRSRQVPRARVTAG